MDERQRGSRSDRRGQGGGHRAPGRGRRPGRRRQWRTTRSRDLLEEGREPQVDAPAMVTEHAILDVTPGQGREFESAFAKAKPIIMGSPGFRSLTLSRSHETPGRFLLLVEWQRLEDHTEGFRKSAGYETWRELLHHFYDPFPTVEHFHGRLEQLTLLRLAGQVPRTRPANRRKDWQLRSTPGARRR